jgi:hypothetical protein
MPVNPARLLALFKSIRLFQGLDEMQLTRMAQAAELIELQEGQSPELDEEQDYPFFAIAAGKVSLAPAESHTDEEYILKKGDFFGADVLLMGEREEYEIAALAPTQLIAINPDRLRILIQNIPQLQANLKEQLRIYRLMRLRQFDWVNEDETVLLIQRKHPAYLLVTLLAPLVFAWIAFAVYLLGTQIEPTSTRHLVEWLATIGLVMIALWAIWRTIDYWNDYYVVTDERVVWLERMFGIYDSRQEAPLAAVKSGRTTTDLFGRMLGYGDVVTEAILGTVTFRHVADPIEIKDLIDHQRQQAQRRQYRSDNRGMEAVIRRKLDPAARPSEVVPMVIIRHPIGEPWLVDGTGDLVTRLGDNNYLVSETDADWGPGGIGSRTDILNLPEWFCGPDTPLILDELFRLRNPRVDEGRSLPDPGGENQVVLLVPGFSNSLLRGGPDDLPQPGRILTIGAAKFVYNSLLESFMAHPDKLFIVVTAPPVSDATWAENARDFTTWLVNDWLVENDYPYNNVVVFDLYNVLTHPENHHHFNPSTGQIDHILIYLENTLYYNGETDRADVEGSQKATDEFIPLLNFYYNRWKASPASPETPPAVVPTGLRLFNYFQTRLVEGNTITYRKHLFILFTRTWLPALLTFGVATATIYYLFQSTVGALTSLNPLVILFFGGLLALIPALWWLYNYIDWRNDIYRVTADRVIDSERKPLGTEITKSAPLENILSMDYERLGLLGVVLNFGNVVVNVGAESKFIFHNIHNPARAQADIFDHIITYRRRKQLSDAKQEWERVSDWLVAYHRQSEEMRRARNSS